MNPFISLVMPVYNSELYLVRALDSILAQTYKAWELILVDDGSKDTSGTICDTYAEKDARIMVVHKSNGGCSAARQTGMQYVRGEYVLHIDSDDWLEKIALEEYYMMISTAQADVIYSNAFWNDSSIWKFLKVETPQEMVSAIFNQKMWGVLWNKMVRTKIAKQWAMVPNDVSMWEDIAYILPCLLHSTSIAYIDKPLYHYNIDNGGSMIHTVQSKNMAIEYCNAVNYFETCLKDVNKQMFFIKELRRLKLHAIRDYVDDIRFRDYDKFIKTYPDAIAHVWEYKDYPLRLKLCAWLIQHDKQLFVPVVCKIDAVFRRFGLSKQF